MPNKKEAQKPGLAGFDATPLVAASLAGVIYQARLTNRQMKLNIPEEEIIADVVGLWRNLMEKFGK